MDNMYNYPKNSERLKTPVEQKDEDYPSYVLESIKQSLKQAHERQLTPYTGIREMLNQS